MDANKKFLLFTLVLFLKISYNINCTVMVTNKSVMRRYDRAIIRESNESIAEPKPSERNFLSLSAAAPPTTDAGVHSQRAAPVGNLVLLPPSLGTSIPRFAAPIIVPSMSPSGGDPCRGSTATNPMTSAPVSDGNDDGIPNCDDDRQLRCFVTSRLQRTLHDCRGLLKVAPPSQPT